MTKSTRVRDRFGQLWKTQLTLRAWRGRRALGFKSHFIDTENQLRFEVVRINLLDGRRQQVWFSRDRGISFLFRPVVSTEHVPSLLLDIPYQYVCSLKSNPRLVLAGYTQSQCPLKTLKMKEKESFVNSVPKDGI